MRLLSFTNRHNYLVFCAHISSNTGNDFWSLILGNKKSTLLHIPFTPYLNVSILVQYDLFSVKQSKGG